MSSANAVGTLAAFRTPAEVARAYRASRERGFHQVEVFSPYDLEELREESALNPLGIIGLLSGLGLAALGFGMEWFSMAFDYPIDVGGRPLLSWPAYLPVTFVLGILGAGLALFTSFFLFTGLPRPYQPLFSARAFSLSADLFYVFLPAGAHGPEPADLKAFFRDLGAESVEEVSE